MIKFEIRIGNSKALLRISIVIDIAIIVLTREVLETFNNLGYKIASICCVYLLPEGIIYFSLLFIFVNRSGKQKNDYINDFNVRILFVFVLELLLIIDRRYRIIAFSTASV